MNKSGITPLGDRCLVEIIKEDVITTGGIHIPDSVVESKEASKAEAILLESGPLASTNVPVWPPDGSHVLIGKYAGVKYQLSPDDPHYRIVNWEDIVGWLKEKSDEHD